MRVKRAGAPRCAAVAPSPSYVTGSTVPLSLATTVGGAWPSAGSRLTRTRSTRWCGTTIDRPAAPSICRHSAASREPSAPAVARLRSRLRSACDSFSRSATASCAIRSAVRWSIGAIPCAGSTVTSTSSPDAAGSTCASALERAGFPATTRRPTKTTAPASAAAPTARPAPRTANRPSQPRLRAASASRISSGRAAQTIASEERTATLEPNSVVCGASSSAASSPIETA